MGIYKYKPIDLERPAVRLLRLLKDGSMDDIQCELFDGWIQQSDGGMSYDALSYTWGGTEKNATITVDGCTMHITSNLYEALQHLQRDDRDRILWIDAICIDQDNQEERGHQVQHMSSIYEEAEEVIIWLGMGNIQSDLLMDFMKRQKRKFMEMEDGDLPKPLIQFPVPGKPEQEDVDVQKLREGMKTMLKQQWFKRIWILQEIANARTATILCGNKSVPAQIFAQIPSSIGLQPDPHCQAILDLMPGALRKKSWWAKKKDLYTLLVKFRQSQATDERDVIYALLGLSSDANKNSTLVPDYKKSVREVIQDATSFLLAQANLDTSHYTFLDWTLPEFLKNLDSLKNSVLAVASESGHDIVVKHLLETIGRDEGFLPGINGNAGWTPMHRACFNGHDAVVRLLMERWDRSFGQKDNEGRTPVFLASMNGHASVVRLLFDGRGADLDVPNNKGQTPLSVAACHGYEDVVQTLAKQGAKLEVSDSAGQKPLLLAAMNGHEAVVRFLLEKGAGLEDRDHQDRTPLFLAAENGHEEVVQILIESGAQLDAGDSKNRTPLLMANFYEHKAVVRHLIKGAGIGAQLFWAARMGHEAVIHLLLEQGINLEMANETGQTALSWAAEWGRKAVVEILLERGAKVESESYSKRTPLSFASETGRISVVQFLLEHGANSNSRDLHGRTPLAWASKGGYAAVVELLLASGADMEAKDSRFGRTPLSLAAGGGHHEVVLMLIERGADLESRDVMYGLTAASWAAQCKHHYTSQILVNRGATQTASEDVKTL